MALHHVLKGGAHEPDRIDAEVLAEAAVLDGDEGVGHIGRQLGDVHHDALGQAAPGDQPAAVVQNGDVARRAVDQQAADVGQIRQKARVEDRAEDDAPRRDQHHDIRPAALARFALGAARGVRSPPLCGDGRNALARAPVVLGLLARHTLTLGSATLALQGLTGVKQIRPRSVADLEVRHAVVGKLAAIGLDLDVSRPHGADLRDPRPYRRKSGCPSP